LTSVSSSKLSLGVFISPFKPFMADKGTFGLFSRFTISTQEGSRDIFRRFEYGFRIENCSDYILRGAHVEVGWTVNKAPGTLDDDRKKLWGSDRYVFNFEVPLVSKKSLGMFAQFHGEWTQGHGSTIELPSGELVDKSVPIYEFRLGAIFDPVSLFGKLFVGP
ncbi:MAG: hypothetical protein ABIJ45_10540, partial [Candidatus Zixiibacteriota bacterium]